MVIQTDIKRALMNLQNGYVNYAEWKLEIINIRTYCMKVGLMKSQNR